MSRGPWSVRTAEAHRRPTRMCWKHRDADARAHFQLVHHRLRPRELLETEEAFGAAPSWVPRSSESCQQLAIERGLKRWQSLGRMATCDDRQVCWMAESL